MAHMTPDLHTNSESPAAPRLRRAIAISLVVGVLLMWGADLLVIRSGGKWLGWVACLLNNFMYARYLWRSSKGQPASYGQLHYPAPESWEVDERSLEVLTDLVGLALLAVTISLPWL